MGSGEISETERLVLAYAFLMGLGARLSEIGGSDEFLRQAQAVFARGKGFVVKFQHSEINIYRDGELKLQSTVRRGKRQVDEWVKRQLTKALEAQRYTGGSMRTDIAIMWLFGRSFYGESSRFHLNGSDDHQGWAPMEELLATKGKVYFCLEFRTQGGQETSVELKLDGEAVSAIVGVHRHAKLTELINQYQ